jgi:DNA-binding NarL/FixJ family response regulator
MVGMGAALVIGFSNPVLGAEHPGGRENVEGLSGDTEAGARPLNSVVADHEALLRAQLTQLLVAKTRLRVIGQTDDGAQMSDTEFRLMPDVVVMDLQNPTSAGVDALRRFNMDSSAVQILVVVADFGDDVREIAGENRSAERPDGEFTAANIAGRILALGSPPSEQAVRRRVVVSQRELVVLAQVAAGLSNKQIGKLLGISQKTVRNHLSRIFGKLEAGNRTEAVMNAMRQGLLSF